MCGILSRKRDWSRPWALCTRLASSLCNFVCTEETTRRFGAGNNGLTMLRIHSMKRICPSISFLASGTPLFVEKCINCMMRIESSRRIARRVSCGRMKRDVDRAVFKEAHFRYPSSLEEALFIEID